MCMDAHFPVSHSACFQQLGTHLGCALTPPATRYCRTTAHMAKSDLPYVFAAFDSQAACIRASSATAQLSQGPVLRLQHSFTIPEGSRATWVGPLDTIYRVAIAALNARHGQHFSGGVLHQLMNVRGLTVDQVSQKRTRDKKVAKTTAIGSGQIEC